MSRLDEIKARADAATKGPWLQDGPWWTDDGGSEPTALPCVVDASRALVVFPPDATDVGMKRPEDRAANMAFIAAAREDVPWLVERVRACSSLLDSNYDQYMRAEIAEAEVERLTAERDALAAQVARVESLAGQWERLAVTAINPDSREWLQACAATLRECLSGWPKMSAALAGSDADTTDTQPTDQEDQS